MIFVSMLFHVHELRTEVVEHRIYTFYDTRCSEHGTPSWKIAIEVMKDMLDILASRNFYFTLRFPWLRTRCVTTHLFGLRTFRVLYPPLAGMPQGLTGSTLPFDFPRPPPWG